VFGYTEQPSDDSSLACRIVEKCLPCKPLHLNEPNSVSEQALSQQLPLRLIEGAMEQCSSIFAKSAGILTAPVTVKEQPRLLAWIASQPKPSREHRLQRSRCMSGRIDQPHLAAE